MARIAAGWIVAVVADHQCLVESAVRECVGDPMSLVLVRTNDDPSVTMGVNGSRPRPTSIGVRVIEPSPESFTADTSESCSK